MDAFYYAQTVVSVAIFITIGIVAIIGFTRRGNGGWILLSISSFLTAILRIVSTVMMRATPTWSSATRGTFFSALGVFSLLEQALYLIAIVLILRDSVKETARAGIAAPHIPPGGVRRPPY